MQSTDSRAYLVYPYKDEVICKTEVANVINYQWQPANPTGEAVSYHLEVVELQSESDKNSPHKAFQYGRVVVDADNLYRSIYTDQITETSYREGYYYAWRVTVKKGYDQNESKRETNQEVRVFQYRCNPVEEPEDTYDPKIIAEKNIKSSLDQITLEEVSYTGADALLKWKEDPEEIRQKYCGVGVEIRKYGGEKWTAFKNTTTEEFEYSLSKLSYNVSYQVRAHYIQCPEEAGADSIYGPYSNVLEFSIPKEDDDSECGSKVPDLADCTDRKAKVLRAGDTIIANGTKIFVDKITSYSSDSSEITGEGHVCFPILTNIQLRMKFNNIKINCEGELAKGEIHAVYDVSTCAMIDFEEFTGENFGGGTEKSPSESKVNTMENFNNGSSGDYFKDTDGTIYMKDEDGNKVKIGQELKLDNTQFSFSQDALTTEVHFVQFSNPSPETVAFDNDKDGYYRGFPDSKYGSYSDKYVIPYLANNPGRMKKLNASEVMLNNTVEPYEDVKFVIEAEGGTYIELIKEDEDKKRNTCVVNVPGSSNCDNIIYVRVLGKLKDSDQYQMAGKLIVCNYKPRTHKLIIVPTSSDYTVDKTKIESGINRIYGRLGITFEVTVDQSFENNQEVLDLLADGLDISTDDQEKRSWDVESPDMKTIRRLYQESHPDMEKEAAYLFLVNKPEEKYAGVEGDMPRNQSVGYIFMNGKNELTDSRLIAHELGHGVFRLQHTFAYNGKESTEKKTDNLMDYNPSNPDFLAHFQWEVMNNTAFFVWKSLQDDEDGMWTFRNIFFNIVWLGDWASGNGMDDQESLVQKYEQDLVLLCHDNKLTGDNFSKSKYFFIGKDYTDCGINPLEDFLDNIRNNTTFSLKDLNKKAKEKSSSLLFSYIDDYYHKNYVYDFSVNKSFVKNDKSTTMYFIPFADDIVLSNYKISAIGDLADNKRVKAGYYHNSSLQYGFITFFDKSYNLSAILAIKMPKLSNEDETKDVTIGWVTYLLAKDPNSFDVSDPFAKALQEGVKSGYNGVLESLTAVSDGIGKFEIKKQSWKSAASTFDPDAYKYQGAPQTALDLEMQCAFVAGLWNSIVGLGKGVVDVTKFAVYVQSPQMKEDVTKCKNFMSNYVLYKEDGVTEVCKGSKCYIKTMYPEFVKKLGEEWDNWSSDPSNYAEFAGELVGGAGLLKLGKIPGIAGKIFTLCDKIQGLPFAVIGNAAKSGFKFVKKQTGKIAIYVYIDAKSRLLEVADDKIVGLVKKNNVVQEVRLSVDDIKSMDLSSKKVLMKNGETYHFEVSGTNSSSLIRDYLNNETSLETKKFIKALNELEDAGEAFLKDFENASSDVIERLVKNPDLVYSWKILSDIKSDLCKNINKLEELGSVIKKNNLRVGKDAMVGKDAIANFIKNNKWDDIDGVITAMKRVSDSNIEGLVLKYKKFPVSQTGSSWVLDNAKKYQGTPIRNADGKLISGSGDANLSFEYNGTSFDNVIDGKLIDNKFGHGGSVFKETDDMFSEFIDEANDLDNITIINENRAKAILKQAERQIKAVDGKVEIEWHVSTELGAKGIQKLFDNAKPAPINIKVKYIKQQ